MIRPFSGRREANLLRFTDVNIRLHNVPFRNYTCIWCNYVLSLQEAVFILGLLILGSAEVWNTSPELSVHTLFGLYRVYNHLNVFTMTAGAF